MQSGTSWLAVVGRKLFRFRLLFGLAVALFALEWLTPAPWFGEGFRLLHTVGLTFVVLGLALRGWGAGSAGGHTRSETIEAPTLITSGPFAFMRNPIYTGSILIGVGMATLITDPRAFLFAGLAFAVLYLAIIPAEEEFLTRQFGEEYLRYRKCVPRFFPRFKPWAGRTKRAFAWKAVSGEIYILLVLVLIYSALLFEEYLDKLGI